MESGQQEESKPLTEESDRSDSVSDDLGTGRSYECMFCKRGFSTAQALGGHMNIHRRDRARIRHQMTFPSSPIKSDDDPPPNSGQFSQFPQQPPYHSPAAESLRNYHAYPSTWPPTSRLPQAFQTDVPLVQKPHPLSLFGEDLQVGPSTRAAQMKEEEAKGQDGEDDELDLELRLGHDL